MQTLLVIDDDPALAELLVEYLGSRGFRVESAPDGHKGLARLTRGGIDLVVLDVMMPGIDGFETCRAIRRGGDHGHCVPDPNLPIVMLTARGDDFDRIVGLEIGADDYLAKPFNPRELLARIKSVLRRAQAPKQTVSLKVTAAGICLEPASRECSIDGRKVELTTTEFDLLHALVAAAGRVIPREGLMAAARGEAWASFDRSVDVHISHIRKKLGDDPRRPTRIKTIRGVGYLVPRHSA